MDKGIFLTVKDLMLIIGCDNLRSTQQAHKAIRDALCKDKRKLTIKEYCKYEGLDFKEIWAFLRNTKTENKINNGGNNGE